MFESLRNFFSRHRKKLIGSAFLVGGGYFAWRVLVPKILDWYLQRMLKQGGLQDLLASIEQQMPPERNVEEQKAEAYKCTQEVCSQYSLKDGRADLDKRLASYFAVDQLTAELSKATSKEEKIKCIEAIQVECLSRSLTALYVLHLFFLLHRIQFNILGREMSFERSEEITESSGRSDEDLAPPSEFLKCVWNVRHDRLSDISEALRKAVKESWATQGLGVTKKISAEHLKGFCIGACRLADSAVVDCRDGLELLLPKALDNERDAKVVKLLDEARDYCESPHFLDVFRSVVDSAVNRTVDSLAQCIDDETVAPLPHESEVPLMKVGGGMVKRSQAMIAEEDGNGFYRGFSESPLLEKLCKAVLFQEESN